MFYSLQPLLYGVHPMYFSPIHTVNSTWWRHQMETFSASLAICAGNSPVTGEFPAQRPVTRRFYVFFDMCLNKRLSKQPRGWSFGTPCAPILTSLWHPISRPGDFTRSYGKTSIRLMNRGPWVAIHNAVRHLITRSRELLKQGDWVLQWNLSITTT